MSKTVNKNKQVSLRISSEIHAKLVNYAELHSLSLTGAVVRLVEKGLDFENIEPATKQDIEQLRTENQKRDLEFEKSFQLLHEAIKNEQINVQLPPGETEKHQYSNPITRWWRGKNKA